MVKKKALMIPMEQRKIMVEKHTGDLSVSKQCSLLGMAKSSYYYSPQPFDQDDLAIMNIMDKMYTEDPTRGTRRYSVELLEHDFKVGRDKIRSYMRTMGIYAIYPKPRTTVIDKTKYKYPYLLRNLKIDSPNHVWEIDISYIPMRYGFMYLTAIIDVYSRFIVGWDISNTMDADWVVRTLKMAVESHGKPQIINSDQGTQFTSEEYISYVKSLKTVAISMDGKGRATDNAHIERFFRTIKHDRLYLNPSANGHELFNECNTFINYYNAKRTHSSIGKIPPVALFKRAA